MSAVATWLSPSREGWIVGRYWDFALFLGTPLLLVVFAEQALERKAELVIVLMGTVGAVAHHFPGLLRAYGDRELFDRRKAKLILAPLIFGILCFTFVFADLEGLSFIILMWGVWHATAQVYGLGRVYDAKAGHFSARTAMLDKSICVSWFATVLLLSPGRLRVALMELYKCGVPAVSPESIYVVQMVAIVVTSGLTGAWLLNTVNSHESDNPESFAKPVLLAGSIFFWWYANIPVQNAIIGVALFELLHDVQYLGFVWSFKRGQIEKASAPGRLSEFMFAPHSAGVILFVGLAVAYGTTFRVSENLLSGTPLRVISAFVLVSTLLHFYTDSLIWNLRERPTRRILDVDTAPGLGETVGGARPCSD